MELPGDLPNLELDDLSQPPINEPASPSAYDSELSLNSFSIPLKEIIEYISGLDNSTKVIYYILGFILVYTFK